MAEVKVTWVTCSSWYLGFCCVNTVNWIAYIDTSHNILRGMIHHPCLNSNGSPAVEDRALMNNSIPLFYVNIIIYACPKLNAGSPNICLLIRLQVLTISLYYNAAKSNWNLQWHFCGWHTVCQGTWQIWNCIVRFTIVISTLEIVIYVYNVIKSDIYTYKVNTSALLTQHFPFYSLYWLYVLFPVFS